MQAEKFDTYFLIFMPCTSFQNLLHLLFPFLKISMASANLITSTSFLNTSLRVFIK